MRGRKTPPTSIDDYLSDVTPDQRAALNALRKSIAKAAPRAVESIRYQLPAFDLDGRALVSFGATKTHCTFYVMSTEAMKPHAKRLEKHATGKGSVQFAPDERLPDSLVTALVKTRIAEFAESAKSRKPKAK